MFSVRLKDLRERDGLSQIRFSEEIGFSQSAVSAWENNTREPGIEALIKIAKFFNTSIDYLVGDIQDIKEPKANNLPTIELKLLKNFRKLPEDLQYRASAYMENLVKLGVSEQQSNFTHTNYSYKKTVNK